MAKRKPKAEEPELPWERRATEPETAWGAFVVYRDMGPLERSLSNVAKKLGKNPRTHMTMSARWQWVERCRAYDAFIDRKKREAELQAILEMRRRHIQASMIMQGAGALAINKYLAAEQEKTTDGKLSPPTLKPSEAKDLIDLGMKVERINRGEPEVIAETRVVPDAEPSTVSRPAERIVYDYSQLSLEELRALKALTNKARYKTAADEETKRGRAGKRDK